MSLHSAVSSYLAIACLATTLTGLCPQAEAKRTFTSATRKIAALPKGLVPPPPPYEPSTLPEWQAWKSIRIRREATQSTKTKSEQVKSEAANPYSRFIYNREGYQSPQPVQPNKYVTYWSKP